MKLRWIRVNKNNDDPEEWNVYVNGTCPGLDSSHAPAWVWEFWRRVNFRKVWPPNY